MRYPHAEIAKAGGCGTLAAGKTALGGQDGYQDQWREASRSGIRADPRLVFPVECGSGVRSKVRTDCPMPHALISLSGLVSPPRG